MPSVQKFDLEELIYDFHECGIHVVIQTSNVGLMLTITDRLSRIRAEQLFELPAQERGAAAQWLRSQALVLFPDGDTPVSTQMGGVHWAARKD